MILSLRNIFSPSASLLYVTLTMGRIARQQSNSHVMRRQRETGELC